ncbi:MAG: hypothetical protein NTZ74_02870 [Chloroflexi bacterium]|nr:hypothetical protein [Chloroflexota bacterium]
MFISTLDKKMRGFPWNLGSSTDSGKVHAYPFVDQSMIRDWVDFQLGNIKGRFFGNEPIKLIAVENTTGSAIALSPFALTTTSSNTSCSDMLILEHMVKFYNIKGFIQITKRINWQVSREEALLNGIRLSLRIGLHSKASELTKIAFSLFPENPEIIKFADAFLPGRGKVTKHTADSGATADMHWLKTEGKNFLGKWVALKGGILLADADNYDELKAKLPDPNDKSVLISPIH